MDRESTELMDLIDRLHAMVVEAWNVPMGNDKCIINRNEFLDIISTVKTLVPAEIAQAKRILSASDEHIMNARNEAATVQRNAAERASQLIEREEIVKMARAKSAELITNAEGEAQKVTRASNEYVNDTLRRTEEALSLALDELRQTRQRFQSASGTKPPQSRGRTRTVTPVEVDEEEPDK